ncbi:flippase-like domain-containing protein [Patescibacteria group bacterium]|nr:flippase-like domain-containing protein [Patescibacteria group bacterium]MBU4511799.1 flippase-like domain-containing protein [Patescibacteria group bacterium]
MKKITTKKILLLLLGLIIFGFILYINKDFSWRSLLGVNITYLTLSFFTSLIMCGLFSYRWGLIVNYVQKAKVMSFIEYFFYYTLSFLIGSFTIHEPVSFTARVAALKASKKISLFKATSATLIERIFDLINLLLVVVPSLLFFLNIISLGLALALSCLAIALLIVFIIFINKDVSHLLFILYKLAIRVIKKIPFLQKRIDTAKLLDETQSIVFTKPFSIKLVLISFVKFLSRGLLFYLLFKTFNINIPLGVVIMSIPITQLALFISFTPGGIGIFEAGWFVILKVIAIAPEDISTFLVGQRVVMLLFIPLMTLIIYAVIMLKKKPCSPVSLPDS